MIKMKKFSSSVDNCFRAFIDSKKASGIRDKTIQTYTQHFRCISKYINTAEKISDLSKSEIDNMIVILRDNGLSANSIRAYTATLKSFLSWCNEEGYTYLTINLYKGKETVKDTYTDSELKKLLVKPKDSFPEYRSWVIINLLLNSGCRAATIRNILIKDVNLNDGVITYRHTKNGSVQIVPLCAIMVKILREYLMIREGEPNEVLFPTQEGKQFTESALYNSIRRYNLSRGVEKTSIHLFRHSYAERYLKAGGQPFDLQRILGHSTLNMTKHYCKVYDVSLMENYDKLSPLANLQANTTRIKMK